MVAPKTRTKLTTGYAHERLSDFPGYQYKPKYDRSNGKQRVEDFALRASYIDKGEKWAGDLRDLFAAEAETVLPPKVDPTLNKTQVQVVKDQLRGSFDPSHYPSVQDENLFYIRNEVKNPKWGTEAGQPAFLVTESGAKMLHGATQASWGHQHRNLRTITDNKPWHYKPEYYSSAKKPGEYQGAAREFAPELTASGKKANIDFAPINPAVYGLIAKDQECTLDQYLEPLLHYFKKIVSGELVKESASDYSAEAKPLLADTVRQFLDFIDEIIYSGYLFNENPRDKALISFPSSNDGIIYTIKENYINRLREIIENANYFKKEIAEFFLERLNTTPRLAEVMNKLADKVSALTKRAAIEKYIQEHLYSSPNFKAIDEFLQSKTVKITDSTLRAEIADIISDELAPRSPITDLHSAFRVEDYLRVLCGRIDPAIVSEPGLLERLITEPDAKPIRDDLIASTRQSQYIEYFNHLVAALIKIYSPLTRKSMERSHGIERAGTSNADKQAYVSELRDDVKLLLVQRLKEQLRGFFHRIEQYGSKPDGINDYKTLLKNWLNNDPLIMDTPVTAQREYDRKTPPPSEQATAAETNPSKKVRKPRYSTSTAAAGTANSRLVKTKDRKVVKAGSPAHKKARTKATRAKKDT